MKDPYAVELSREIDRRLAATPGPHAPLRVPRRGAPDPMARWQFPEDRFDLRRWIVSKKPGAGEGYHVAHDPIREVITLVINAWGDTRCYDVPVRELMQEYPRWRSRVAKAWRDLRRNHKARRPKNAKQIKWMGAPLPQVGDIVFVPVPEPLDLRTITGDTDISLYGEMAMRERYEHWRVVSVCLNTIWAVPL